MNSIIKSTYISFSALTMNYISEAQITTDFKKIGDFISFLTSTISLESLVTYILSRIYDVIPRIFYL
jgi:hypothetical protein